MFTGVTQGCHGVYTHNQWKVPYQLEVGEEEILSEESGRINLSLWLKMLPFDTELLSKQSIQIR